MDERESDLLLADADPAAAPGPVEAALAWKIAHAFDFLLGGSTFVLGTTLYLLDFVRTFWWTDVLSAALYTLGSLGFLAVDVQEFLTFYREPLPLRANIAMSACGSFFYVVGSVGYFPAFSAGTTLVGQVGFVLGSLLIGVSQFWKVTRIARAAAAAAKDQRGGDGEGESTSSSGGGDGRAWGLDAATQVGVELSAGIGAWFFFFGTAATFGNWMADPSYPYLAVLAVWELGSIGFFAGGMFLAFRHFVMGL